MITLHLPWPPSTNSIWRNLRDELTHALAFIEEMT